MIAFERAAEKVLVSIGASRDWILEKVRKKSFQCGLIGHPKIPEVSQGRD